MYNCPGLLHAADTAQNLGCISMRQAHLPSQGACSAQQQAVNSPPKARRSTALGASTRCCISARQGAVMCAALRRIQRCRDCSCLTRHLLVADARCSGCPAAGQDGPCCAACTTAWPVTLEWAVPKTSASAGAAQPSRRATECMAHTRRPENAQLPLPLHTPSWPSPVYNVQLQMHSSCQYACRTQQQTSTPGSKGCRLRPKSLL